MIEKTDEQIAHEVQYGNTEAFAHLVERYEAKLMRYAHKFLFDSEDASDLIQEVFLKAYINIRSFDVKRKFSSWIYRIAHNEYINAIKKRGKEKSTFFDFDLLLPHLISKNKSEDQVLAGELRALLDTHLNHLDAKYREPLVLYYFEEFDYQEIADILKIPISTVGIRLRRGKTNLKKMLKKDKDI